MNKSTCLNTRDIDLLRRLAERVAAAAESAANRERRDAWHALDAGRNDRPMVLAEVGGVMEEVLPDTILQCSDPYARNLERWLRVEIYQFEELQDDHVIEPYANVNWKVTCSGYGVAPVQHRPDNDGRLGARRWDPPIRDLDRDFSMLRTQTFSVDREATLAEKDRLEHIFGGILKTRIRGQFWWTRGMTITAIDFIGLEPLMMAMFDNPAGLHRLMAFLRDDHIAFARWLEQENLLSLNNENDYIGSGSMGYTRDLPKSRPGAGRRVMLDDLWLLLESQETVGVGPDQFEEFIFPYQRDIGLLFGKIYYGCCEPVHTRLHVLEKLPNLARISVSPWADEEFISGRIGRRYVYSRKPNPSLISTERFDEALIRADLRRTLDVARGCRLEIIMKDVHTLNRQRDRLARWVRIAREEIEKSAGW